MMNDAENNTIMRSLGRVFHVKTVLVTGALLLMTSSILGWIDRPVLGWLVGFRMPLSEKLPAMLSYGVLCFAAGLISLLAVFNRFRWVGVVTGGAAVLLSLHFLLAYSILNAKDIILVNELNQQEARMVLFNNKYLPICFMINPTFDPAITTDTIIDRLYATIHFSTFGWYAAVLGSVLIFLAVLKLTINIKVRIVSGVSLISLALLYLCISALPFCVAEYHRNKGEYYLGAGMYYNALSEYEVYRSMDKNSEYIKSFHNHIGKAYYFVGRQDMADSLIYRGSIFMDEYNYPLAIFYYTSSIASEPSIIKTVGNSLLALAYVRYGIYEYENIMKGSAIESWKQSLKTNPSQIEAYYYLSRAYYDMSSYEESVMAGLQFVKLSRNRIRNAEMSCNVADSLYKMKRFGQAREFYLKSLDLVSDGNQRALMSLVGR
jgi:tetratricopeptide (TPR) repeat protein